MHAVVHAHFYQPPREDPWTGVIEEQPDAAPFHDWNERILAECYRPNAFARIPVGDREQEVNNYERLSFNMGPTLLRWLEQSDPATYTRIIQADRRSAIRLGHGNAIAQAFHHSILPLAPLRDARTEIRWGVADFRHRFDRDPEGLWLPETAANDRILTLLIDEGIGFTILAPQQAGRFTTIGDVWQEVSETTPLDTRRAYLYVHPDGSGRSISVFFYDGEIARAIAFEQAAASAEHFTDLFARNNAGEGELVQTATDGETYGHHHRFAELGLAYALFVEGERRGVEFTNYPTYLERFPARRQVALWSGATSWSCSHGVERWRSDCGCWTRGEEGWNQAWRTPLRASLELLRDAADDAFERLGDDVLKDPWRARDHYVEVVVGATSPEVFVKGELRHPTADDGTALRLLELQSNALAMFTSCGWFFSDCSGIETIQVLRYARRVLELLDEVGAPAPHEEFLATLAEARSNISEFGTAADIYRAEVVP